MKAFYVELLKWLQPSVWKMAKVQAGGSQTEPGILAWRAQTQHKLRQKENVENIGELETN